VGWGAQAARGPGAPGMGVGPRGAQARGYFIRPHSHSLLYIVLYPCGGGGWVKLCRYGGGIDCMVPSKFVY